jgi:hypothetical protein
MGPVSKGDVLDADVCGLKGLRGGDGHIKDATVAHLGVMRDDDAPLPMVIEGAIGAAIIDATPDAVSIGGVLDEDDGVKGQRAVSASEAVVRIKGLAAGGDGAMPLSISVPRGAAFLGDGRQDRLGQGQGGGLTLALGVHGEDDGIFKEGHVELRGCRAGRREPSGLFTR